MNIEGIDTKEAKDFRAGQVCATVANWSMRESDRTIEPDDFFRSLKIEKKEVKPIILDDPKAHARLIMSQVFGITMEAAYGKK